MQFFFVSCLKQRNETFVVQLLVQYIFIALVLLSTQTFIHSIIDIYMFYFIAKWLSFEEIKLKYFYKTKKYKKSSPKSRREGLETKKENFFSRHMTVLEIDWKKSNFYDGIVKKMNFYKKNYVWNGNKKYIKWNWKFLLYGPKYRK